MKATVPLLSFELLFFNLIAQSVSFCTRTWSEPDTERNLSSTVSGFLVVTESFSQDVSTYCSALNPKAFVNFLDISN